MRRAITFVAALSLGLAACGGGGAVAPDLTGTWLLSESRTADGPIVVPDGATVSAEFADGQVGGVAACNQYFGEYQVNGDAMTIGQLGQTDMGCEEPRMRAETAFLAALMEVTTLTREGDVLTLSGPGMELVFDLRVPEPDAPLSGTIWLLDTLISGDTASTTLGAQATLSFADDGSFTASTGCRSLTGSWTRDGARVATRDVGADDVECGDLAQQDALVLGVLESGFTVEITERRMTLTAEDTGLGYGIAEDA